MDYEFFLRLAFKGYKFCHISNFLADFRIHAQSKSQKQLLKQKEEMEQALLEQDVFLSQLSNPWRKIMRTNFMVMARLKRYVLEICHRGVFLR